MPTRDGDLAELAPIFRLISGEYVDRIEALPANTAEIVHGLTRSVATSRVPAVSRTEIDYN